VLGPTARGGILGAAEDVVQWRQLVVARLSMGTVELPMVPILASRVLDLVQSDRATIRGLTEVIQKDQVIASKILKLANTMLYAARNEVTGLNQAVVRMGFTEVRNLVVGLTLGSTMTDKNVYGDRGTQLQLHSIGAAYCAKTVADKVRGLNAEEAFMCGLFHDIGKMVLLKIAWDLQAESGRKPVPAAVDAVLEHYHASAGALALRKWGLPTVLEDAIRFHHEPESTEAAPTLARVTYAADRMCHLYGFGCEPEPLELESDPHFQELGLDAAWLGEQHERLPGIFEVASRIFA
jgi:putative nucleotidyltransferase with HDIG domain